MITIYKKENVANLHEWENKKEGTKTLGAWDGSQTSQTHQVSPTKNNHLKQIWVNSGVVEQNKKLNKETKILVDVINRLNSQINSQSLT